MQPEDIRGGVGKLERQMNLPKPQTLKPLTKWHTALHLTRILVATFARFSFSLQANFRRLCWIVWCVCRFQGALATICLKQIPSCQAFCACIQIILRTAGPPSGARGKARDITCCACCSQACARATVIIGNCMGSREASQKTGTWQLIDIRALQGTDLNIATMRTRIRNDPNHVFLGPTPLLLVVHCKLHSVPTCLNIRPHGPYW